MQSGIEELEEICHNINKYEQERNFPADKDTHSGLRWLDAGRGKLLVEIADGEEYILPESRKAGQYRNTSGSTHRKVCKDIMREYFA